MALRHGLHRFLETATRFFSLAKLIFICFITRVLGLYLLPDEVSPFAPDEGIYASLAAWIAQSKDVNSFPGFGPGLYHESKVFVLPAAALISFDINSLFAVRIVSMIFGLLSIYFFSKIVFFLFNIRGIEEIGNSGMRKFTVISLTVFAFFPSLFIWSILGIKETSSIATILFSVFLLFRLRKSLSKSKKQSKLLERILLLVATPFAIALSFGTRKETSLVFVISFCLMLILTSETGTRSLLLAIVLTGALLGLNFSATPTIGLDEQKTQNVIRNAINQIPLKTLDELEGKREINRIDARTALPPTKCLKRELTFREDFFCNVDELPFRLFSFLVRPLPIIDAGSLLNNLGSIENLFWVILLALFLLGVYLSFRFKLERRNVLPIFAFFITFSSLAALYEGNLGTAFRHKSTILWTLFLAPLIVVCSHWSQVKKIRQGKSPR